MKSVFGLLSLLTEKLVILKQINFGSGGDGGKEPPLLGGGRGGPGDDDRHQTSPASRHAAAVTPAGDVVIKGPGAGDLWPR